MKLEEINLNKKDEILSNLKSSASLKLDKYVTHSLTCVTLSFFDNISVNRKPLLMVGGVKMPGIVGKGGGRW